MEDESLRSEFLERYGRQRSEAAREVERIVLGHDVGLNGYTTLPQADGLVDVLVLSSSSTVLDLGSGRGWPGLHLATAVGCRVVVTDRPIAALRQARVSALRREVSRRVDTVAAEGSALPFGPACFDAVVHADVLC